MKITTPIFFCLLLMAGCEMPQKQDTACKDNGGLSRSIVVISGLGNTNLFLCLDGTVRWEY